MSKRITFTDDECALARSALTYMSYMLEEQITSHGELTKWARKEIREQLISLRSKFEMPE